METIVYMPNLQPELGNRIKKLRLKAGISQDELANKVKLHRTAIQKIEMGEREPSLANASAICDSLNVPIQELTKSMPIREATGMFFDIPTDFVGFSKAIIKQGIEGVYSVLDVIDFELSSRSVDKMSALLELANLSAMVGNVIGSALASASNGVWVRNGPHKFPDLVRKDGSNRGVEIKVALEKNTPKGHLPKAGLHLSVRYVLTHSGKGFKFISGKRGDSVSIWEVKCGYLSESDFNISNTPGDSGKTANFSSEAFQKMKVVYFDKNLCPYGDVEAYCMKNGFTLSQRKIKDFGK